MMSLVLVIPGARLYSRELFRAISKAHSHSRPLPLTSNLLQEILQWRFLDIWNGFLPWLKEHHCQIRLCSDASNTGWGGIIYTPDSPPVHMNGLWPDNERKSTIVVREALALYKTLYVAANTMYNARLDCHIDNQVLIYSWNQGGSKNKELTDVLKDIFHLGLRANFHLVLHYVPSLQNPADYEYRLLTDLDCTLPSEVWQVLQQAFGPHSVDLMTLPSNVQRNTDGHPLRFFSPYPTQQAAGTNVFAQTIFPEENAYVFPPFVLIGPLLRFLHSPGCPYTIVVPDLSPRRYWWPLLVRRSSASIRLGVQGDRAVLKFPSQTPSGFHFRPLQWDLWAFRVQNL